MSSSLSICPLLTVLISLRISVVRPLLFFHLKKKKKRKKASARRSVDATDASQTTAQSVRGLTFNEKRVPSFRFCRALVFPPVNNYRRYIIHQLVQDRFPDLLQTFSIGQGLARRTVVCFKSDVRRYTEVLADFFLPVVPASVRRIRFLPRASR